MSDVMEVKGSPAKLIGLLAIGALLTVASAALAFRWFPATPRGIKDARLAADVVPWSAIRDISTAVFRSQEYIVLAVEPSFEQRLALTLIAKWTRGPNRALGIDGLCVSAIGLMIDHDALLRACLTHWRAARRPR
jgi:hypothetical protein